MKLIVNRAPSAELAPGILEEIEKQGLDLLGVVPQDPNIFEFDSEGKPTSALPAASPARAAFEPMLKTLFE